MSILKCLCALFTWGLGRGLGCWEAAASETCEFDWVLLWWRWEIACCRVYAQWHSCEASISLYVQDSWHMGFLFCWWMFSKFASDLKNGFWCTCWYGLFQWKFKLDSHGLLSLYQVDIQIELDTTCPLMKWLLKF